MRSCRSYSQLWRRSPWVWDTMCLITRTPFHTLRHFAGRQVYDNLKKKEPCCYIWFLGEPADWYVHCLSIETVFDANLPRSPIHCGSRLRQLYTLYQNHMITLLSFHWNRFQFIQNARFMSFQSRTQWPGLWPSMPFPLLLSFRSAPRPERLQHLQHPTSSGDYVFNGTQVSETVLVSPSVLSAARVAVHVCIRLGQAVAVLVPVGRSSVLVVVRNY